MQGISFAALCRRLHLLRQRSLWQFGLACTVILSFMALALPLSLPLSAYQWPLPTKQIVQGFLAGRRASESAEQRPLPSLGYWFKVDDAEEDGALVQPYHSGEIIYYETSSDMETIGPIPRNISHTMVVQNGKLLLRYSSDKLQIRLQDAYQINNEDKLFTLAPKSEPQAGGAVRRANSSEAKPRLYMEVFDTQFQTIINPKLIMPSTGENLRSSQPFVETVATGETEGDEDSANDNVSAAIRRPLRHSDQLLRGIYNLSFLFPQNQGLPLQLHVDINGKKIYSELFDQVYGINSKLIINDRDLQDIYTLDEQESKFFLGTINLQDKANSSVRLSVDEEYIDGSHSVNDYNIRIR